MSPTYKSGAFAQQCFASHPLCLALKRLPAPGLIVLTCSSCRFQHYVRTRSLTTQLSLASNAIDRQVDKELPAEEHLTRCAHAHAAALRVSGMDVVQGSLELRCAECRRVYAGDVEELETHGR